MLISNSCILQGGVATCLVCGGNFSDRFIANFLENVPVKEFLNRSIFAEDGDMSMVSFLTHGVEQMQPVPVVKGN